MKHQVHVATNLIVDIPNADEVRRLVKHHHERWDGRGYPDGLKGDEIPYLARILSVAEAFAAVTLDRPYRRGLPVDQACRELRSAAGSQLDPALVTRFIEMVASADEYAEGSPTVEPAAQRAG
jgi:polar amino acid transport system substrate-binding protein